MAGREVTVRIWLSDDELATLARLVAEQEAWQRQHRPDSSPWTEETELRMLLSAELFRKKMAHQDADEVAKVMAQLGALAPVPPAPPVPAWLQALELLDTDDPLLAFPPDLAAQLDELEKGGQG